MRFLKIKFELFLKMILQKQFQTIRYWTKRSLHFIVFFYGFRLLRHRAVSFIYSLI